MKQLMMTVGAFALTAGLAHAGGIDRTRTPYSALFEEGKYLSFGLESVSPSMSGKYPASLGGGSTGDMAPSYLNYSFVYKQDLGEKTAIGLFVNTPYGADAFYHQGFYDGLNAQWQSQQMVLMLKQDLNDAFSVYGGLRYVSSTADIGVPDQMIRAGLAASGSPTGAFVAANSPAGTLEYSASGARTGDFGYVLGAAYQRPDIALRIGLTYESSITQSFKTTESVASPFITGMFGTSTTDVELPQALTLDFQTGVAPETLLFGSVKWTDWSEWEVRPQGYDDLTGQAITGYEDDIITWQLGLGRQVTEELALFARATYERNTGTVSSRLSPYNGMSALGLGANWQHNGFEVTGGIEYAWLGDTFDSTDTQFDGNTAVGVGVQVGYHF